MPASIYSPSPHLPSSLPLSPPSSPVSFPVRLSGWPSQLLDFARFVAAGPGATEEELAEVSEECILGGGRG